MGYFIKNQIPKNLKVEGLQYQVANGLKRSIMARYPNNPLGLEQSPLWNYVIPGENATWTPPDLNKYGPIIKYQDNQTDHIRPNDAGYYTNYMIGINGTVVCLIH